MKEDDLLSTTVPDDLHTSESLEHPQQHETPKLIFIAPSPPPVAALRRLSTIDEALINNLDSPESSKRRPSLSALSNHKHSISMNSVQTYSDIQMFKERRNSILHVEDNNTMVGGTLPPLVQSASPKNYKISPLRRAASDMSLFKKSILKKSFNVGEHSIGSPSSKSVIFSKHVQVKETLTLHKREHKRVEFIKVRYWQQLGIPRLIILVILFLFIVYQSAMVGSQWKSNCNRPGLRYLFLVALLSNCILFICILAVTIVGYFSTYNNTKKIVPDNTPQQQEQEVGIGEHIFDDNNVNDMHRSPNDANNESGTEAEDEEEDVPITPFGGKKRKDSLAAYRAKLMFPNMNFEDDDEVKIDETPDAVTPEHVAGERNLTIGYTLSMDYQTPSYSKEESATDFNSPTSPSLSSGPLYPSLTIQSEPNNNTKNNKKWKQSTNVPETMYFQPLQSGASTSPMRFYLRRTRNIVLLIIWLAFHALSLSTLTFVIDRGNCHKKSKVMYYGNLVFFVLTALVSILETILVLLSFVVR
jgi:hypothetical protein